MTDQEHVERFADALDKLVEFHRAEFDLTFASAVGVLTYKAFLLMQEADERGKEES